MASEGPERRLAAILFTDIAGYTAIMARSEERGLAARRLHRELVVPVIERSRGEVIEARGDESLSLFGSAVDAVRCAQELAREADSAGLRLHIGIHSGEVVVLGDEVSGDAVNIASRVCAASEPGEILLSGELWASLRNQPDIGARSLGLRSLKNVGRPVELYALPSVPSRAAPGEQTELSPSDAPSIAVLPFVNMSSDPENEYLGDGIAEELINGLCKVPGLKVVARTSAFYFKGRELDLREVGRRLNVGTVLEGSIRKSGKRVRITAQLVSVADGYHLWSERYDRELDDLFELQDDVAANVIAALEDRLDGSETRTRVHAERAEQAAYELYLKGRYFLETRTEEGLQSATRYFDEAHAADPTYAPALAWRALTCVVLGIYSRPSWLQEGERWAARALQVDPRSGIARAALGYVRGFHGLEWERAVDELREAASLDPDTSQVRSWYGSMLFCLGRWEDGHREIRAALRRDPLSPVMRNHAAEQLYARGRLDEALAQVRETLEVSPDYYLAHCTLGLVLLAQNELEEAVAASERALERSARAPFALANYGRVCAGAGRRAEARAALDELEQRTSRGYERPALLACVAAALGEKDLAFAHLDRALEVRDIGIVPHMALRGFSALEGDPRFARVLSALNLPPGPGG